MPDIKSTGSETPPPSASELRKMLVDERMAEARKAEQQKQREQKQLDDFIKGEM